MSETQGMQQDDAGAAAAAAQPEAAGDGRSQALQSQHWWRIAGLRPRLRGHIHIHRHAYRGQPWYVIEDRVAGRYHRFNLGAYRVLQCFDGRRTLDQIWLLLAARMDEATPTQDEVVELLGQLHAADLVQFDVTPDVAELLQRRGREWRRRTLSRFLNPMSLRFPLWDPDAFLGALAARTRALQGRLGWALWLAALLPALLLVPSHWPDLTQNFGEQLLAVDNLLLMGLVFPLLKAVHELAHGLAVKLRGGEVHEMGVMLLVLFPVPYVDASGSAAFARKRDRMLVGAAGMAAELFVAALAFYAWLLMEPGLARSLAYNAVVLGSVTTVLFNANPLMRYDGYYVLMDAVEMPNLGQRANRHWQQRIEHRVFGLPPPRDDTHDSPGERRWLTLYPLLAVPYRLSVSLGIALFIAGQYFFFGVVLALVVIATSVVWPLAKGLRAVLTQPRFAVRARRVRAVLAGTAVALALLLFVLPLPHHTDAQGVVALPEQALLRAGTHGFVQEVLAPPGAVLAPGDAVLRSADVRLDAALAEQQARLEEAQARLDAAWGTDPAKAGQLRDAVQREQAALLRQLDERERLVLRARAHGTLLLDRAADLPQRYLRQGEVVGHLVGREQPLVQVAVTQDDVDRVRLATERIELRLAQQPGQSWPARLLRERPKAADELPSAALGRQGGGPFELDPGDRDGVKALQTVFVFELQLPPQAPAGFLGSRVHVRFEHPAEPLGLRMARAARRLFLSHFAV